MLTSPLSLVALFLVSSVAAQEIWWTDIQATFGGSVANLKHCGKRNNIAPADGSICSAKPKTCFFGNQDCNGDGTMDYPTERCVCSGKPEREWDCTPELCSPTIITSPGYPVPPCPAQDAFIAGEMTCGVVGQTCDYTWDFNDCDEATQGGGQGINSAACTCNDEFILDCTLSAEAISCFPPSLSACPTEEAFRGGDLSCLSPGAPCDYEWDINTCNTTTQTGIIGSESATCLCDGAALECDRGVQGVSCTVPTVVPPVTTPHDEICQDLDHNNDPLCPATEQIGMGCSTEQNGIDCSWGEESCCGNCNVALSCSCFDGFWACFYTDACLLQSCSLRKWHDLPGMTCAAATAAIHAEFPGMSVICLQPGMPAPTDFNQHRYLLRLDAGGLVTDVAFNRFEPCPTSEQFLIDKSCSAQGQQCRYERTEGDCDDVAQTGSIITFNDVCTCVFGQFDCDSSAVADVCFPPAFPFP